MGPARQLPQDLLVAQGHAVFAGTCGSLWTRRKSRRPSANHATALPENGPWLLASDRPLANACGSVTLSNQGSCYRATTVREWLRTLSALSLSLKMAHWLLARANFHGSSVSRRLMTN